MRQKNKTIFLLFIFSTVFLYLAFFLFIKAAKADTSGMVIYGKTGTKEPAYKIWDGASFGTEAFANTTDSGIRWGLLQGIPRLRNEKIMATVAGGSNTLYVQRWNGTSWSQEWNVNLTAATNRNFTIAYEQISGNALVIYGDNTTQIKYRKWDGSTWTGELSAGTILDDIPVFVQAVGRPPWVNHKVNDIVVMVTTNAGSLYAMRWNNGVWGDQIKMTTNPAQITSDVASAVYETQTGQIMVIWGAADKTIRYRKFTDSWQAEAIAYSDLSANASWLKAGADRLYDSNRASIIWNDAGPQIQFGLWNGSNWETRPAGVDTGNIDKRNLDTVWEKHTGKAMFVFSTKTPNGKALSWRTWTVSDGFSTTTQESGSLSQNVRWLQLRPDSKSNNIMLLALDTGGNLSSRRWNGTNWESIFTTIVTGISSATTEPFNFFWDDTQSFLQQNAYRWYADNDQLTPTDPWSANRSDFSQDIEETSVISSASLPPATTEKLRLRVNFNVGLIKLVAGESHYKFQFAQKTNTCSTTPAENWTSLGNIGTSAIWRGVNGAPVAGTALSSDPPTAGDLKLNVSDRAGTYEEENPSALNPYEAAEGEDVEYDWFIQDNGALAETNYCFRMVNIDDEPFFGYTAYPELITSGYRARSQNWRWFTDENNETPAVALANENTAPTGIENQNILKLRLTIADTADVAGIGIKFKLQFSENSDFSQGVYDVVEKGDCAPNSVWCYADGIDQDDAVITARKLSDSVIKGRHNESGVSSSTLNLAASSIAEVEFTIKPAGPQVSTTYYFRVYNVTKDAVVLTNSEKTYPNLVTEEAKLSFTISGLPAGTSTEGIVTDITTTASGILFGTLGIQTQLKGAQRLTVTTNAANGYQIFIYQDQGLVNGPLEIVPITGTNAAPTSWRQGCVSTADSCYGYHSSDDCLFGCSDRFASDDTYAKLETTPKEIAYNSYPVTNETVDIVFKVQVSPLHSAGTYSGTIRYIIIPYF